MGLELWIWVVNFFSFFNNFFSIFLVLTLLLWQITRSKCLNSIFVISGFDTMRSSSSWADLAAYSAVENASASPSAVAINTVVVVVLGTKVLLLNFTNNLWFYFNCKFSEFVKWWMMNMILKDDGWRDERFLLFLIQIYSTWRPTHMSEVLDGPVLVVMLKSNQLKN